MDKHLKNKKHPLRILLDLFSEEFQDLVPQSKKALENTTESNEKKTGQGKNKRNSNKYEITIAKVDSFNEDMEFTNDNSKEMRLKRFNDLAEEVKTFSMLFKRVLLTFY